MQKLKWWEWCFENRMFFYPLLVPMAGWYVLDFIRDLMQILQIVSLVVIAMAGASFFGGVWLAIMDRPAGENLFKKRITRLLLPTVWGFHMVLWLTEDDD